MLLLYLLLLLLMMLLSILDLPFADESVVLVVGVVLCIPLELRVKVHVQIRAASRFVLLEVSEHHLSSGDPLKALVPISVKTSQPVVCSVLRVDHVEDRLDEVALCLV